MAESLQFVGDESVVTGWDFSTGGVKCLAFDLNGETLAEVRLPTDLWKGFPSQDDVSELSLLQLEGQARASVRGIANRLRKIGRLDDWIAGGISATHHTAGRIDADRNPVRRAICWNDHTLVEYHKRGLKRLGGQAKAVELIGGPWAIRYSLSHLAKDEDPGYLPPEAWRRTHRILPHGPLAAGYLTGNFDVTSVSSAASTGMFDLVKGKWRWEMLDALADAEHRSLARKQLPKVIDHFTPVGPLAEHVALESGLTTRPLVFPTSDDQQAGLVGGGAVEAGALAIVLGNSAVVNSSSQERPKGGNLDVMRLNWGPYLWMRCYNNGAQFLDRVIGTKPDWKQLEKQARAVSAGCEGTSVMPFERPEPSLKVTQPHVVWSPSEPKAPGVRYRAALEALAYLMALAVREHEKQGQRIERISVSGGIARSDLMCEILASVLNRRLERLKSEEGPALGAAVTALAAMETHLRRQHGVQKPFTVGDGVAQLVKFREPVQPNPTWTATYEAGLAAFKRQLQALPRATKGKFGMAAIIPK